MPRTCYHIGLGFRFIPPISPQNPQIEKKLKHQYQAGIPMKNLEETNTKLPEGEMYLQLGSHKIPTGQMKPC